MGVEQVLSDPACVLVIDDDPISLRILETMIKNSGHRFIGTNSCAGARNIITQHETKAFDCVITDYQMPGETGLDLLFWIGDIDPTLAVVMITATTEREIVASTLRGGASDFLDKPITPLNLNEALSKGIKTTRQRRRLLDADMSLRQVGKSQGQMFGLSPQSAPYLTVCYHPRHAAGGDFVNFFKLTPESFHVIVADVSGHDMRAAFVSAFFQGLTRGMIEAGASMTRVFQRFNRILGWNGHETGTGGSSLESLCACAISVDFSRHELTMCNHGIPHPWLINGTGDLMPCPVRTDSPLGWFDTMEFTPQQTNLPERSAIVVWSDGLEDLADALAVSPLSLAARLLRARLETIPALELGAAKDDVLVVSIRLASDADPGWLPVLSESYPGGAESRIDEIQLHLERSIGLALPDLPEARRFDVILTLREALINALKYGCKGQKNLSCSLTMAFNPAQSLLRIRVKDPGEGHQFDWGEAENNKDLADLHRGLMLIHLLATRVSSERKGAELTLDFSYQANPVAPRP